MRKSIQVIPKKRGRPKTTGKGHLIGVRLHEPELKRLDFWITQQRDPPSSRPEALRRMMEQALNQRMATGRRDPVSRDKASALARQEIERLSQDESALPEEHERRKRRLLKGPGEFRDLRAVERGAKRR